MIEQETKRTIEEVLDVETGEIIKSDIFFQKPESEIIAFRRRLQEAIAGFELPKFRCAYCNQLLKLSGKATRRGQISFFSHLYDSEDCEIKTNGELSKEEIEARKYSNIQESERHIKLKNQLAVYLKSTPDVSNVEIEKRITSETPYLYWRRPDVYAEYNEKRIVFELQLSTTFLSVIIERDIFYRFNNTFIIWVFNFSDNQEYVNFQNLMIKDIYYANKRNAFVLDERAQELSEDTGELHLLCIWFEPLIRNGVYQKNHGIRKEEYIKVSDLKFDSHCYKPYYIDADALFAEYEPRYFETRTNFENLHKLRLEQITKKNKETQFIQLSKEQKIGEKKEQLIQGESKLKLFQKGEKWGYEADGIEIVEPKYTECTDFSNSDFAKVKYNRKYGFINKIGEFAFAPIFVEAFNIFNNKCIGKNEKDWYIIDLEKKSSILLECFNVAKLTDKLLRITFRVTKKVFSRVNKGGYNTYSNQHADTFSVFSMDGQVIKKCLHYKIYELNNGRLISKIREYFLCFDENGNSLSIDANEKKYINTIHTGIIDDNENIVIPFEYDSIEDFMDGRAKAKKNFKCGYIDEQGKTLIPFEYEAIEEFTNGIAKAKKNGKYGYIDEQGKVIVKFEYDTIGDFIDGKAKAKKDGKYGYIDKQEETIIKFEFDLIEDFIDGRAKAKKHNRSIFSDPQGKYGIIDEQGKTLVTFEFDTIGFFLNGKAEAKKHGNCGFINEQGQVIIPFEYDTIGQFVDGKAIAKKKYSGYGCIGEKGQIIIPFEYDEILKFIDGKAKAKKNEKYGYINEQGETLIPFEYDSIGDFIENTVSAKKNFHNGIIDINGNALLQNIKIIKGNARKGEKFGKWGVEDLEGNLIIPFEYDTIEEFIDGKAKVKSNGKYGYIDEKGQPFIPLDYDLIEDFTDGKAKAKRGYKSGYIDEQGEIIIPFEYDTIEDFIDGKAKANKNGKYGYINEQGMTIIPFEYDLIGDFIDGRAKAKKNGELAIIDYNGNGIVIFKESKIFKGRYGETITEYLYGIKDTHDMILLPPKYYKIDEFKSGFAKIYGNKKYIGGGDFVPRFKYKVGYVDENGKIAVSCVFDEISAFVNGKAKAKKNGKHIVVDIYGHELKRNKIDLSILKLNSIYKGKIIKAVKFGLFVDLGKSIIALLHISELNKHQKSTNDYIKGQEIEVQIINIDDKRNSISLTLTKQGSK